MTTQPFEFLRAEFPHLYEGACNALNAALGDPRVACFHARWTIEQAINWAYAHDQTLTPPYENGVSARLHAPAFKALIGDNVFKLARETIRLGNRAVHKTGAPSQRDAVTAVSHLFEFCYWFARTYATDKPPPGLTFDPHALPKPAQSDPSTADEIAELQRALEESEQARRRALDVVQDQARLDAELQALRTQVAAAKAAATATPDDHDYTEAETRDYLIDLLLRESGWTLDQARDREFEVTGMPNETGVGYVDYVLWGVDGKPLAVIEAKRTRRDARVGQHQAQLYADCLEATFGQRPIIYYTNGYDHWLWDDTFAPPRSVQGFATRDELALMIQRRTTRKPLAEMTVDPAIAERYYQIRAITRIGETFDVDRARRALLVMATGAGKTRTVIALADVLMRANWAKRVLFLADRTALVKQATNAFKAHLPDSSPVNLVTDRNGEGRVMVSTYPTMMNLLNSTDAQGRRRFSPAHFDLVIIDEAHRSVFNKYRAIFGYFDAYLVGLTATPRDEIDHNTYDLFGLENGVPTDAYGLDEAVADGFLVPPKAISVPLRFQREGIRYDDLTDDEKDAWDAIDWDDDDSAPPPSEVGAEAINKWLFNTDTVDKVLAHVMTHGIRVDDGNRLGKTIIFAKNQAHAAFIEDRFNASYPHLRGEFARVITHATEYAQDLIDKFSIADRAPHIAISVDMLDTGIDVPEVVNLVFFKLVRSKMKFWQMIGRGTRLCPDLLAPGVDKSHFAIFDYCQNLEYFNQHPDAADNAAVAPLDARLFTARLDLIASLDAQQAASPGRHADLRRAVAAILCQSVASMPLENIEVRPHRRLVEAFSSPDAWCDLGVADAAALARNIAALPSTLEPEPVEAKQFDLLALRLELALLETDPAFTRLARQTRIIADALEEYPTIPAIAAELPFITEIQSDEWWADVTVEMIDDARRRLRLLVPFIEKHKRKIIYTNFVDEIGDSVEVGIGGLIDSGQFEAFRRKVRAFLTDRVDIVAVEKLRRNRPITQADLAELERVLVESGVGTTADVARAGNEAGGLGLFVRGLVGLDRAAAKAAFAEFLIEGRYRANQIEFVNLIIDHLTETGVIEARRFYESPFTDLSPTGPDDVFTSDEVDRLFAAVAGIRHNAEVA